MTMYKDILNRVAGLVPDGAMVVLSAMVEDGQKKNLTPVNELATDVGAKDANAGADALFPMDSEQSELLGLLKQLPLSYEMFTRFFVSCALLSA